jgi:hypothetical protein
VPRGEVLPPELLQGEFVLREGERPCLKDIYPWTFEGDPHVMSTIQSQVAMAGPSCLKDLVKWRTFGLIMPHNNHTISGVHTVGNVFFEKGGLIPYPRFRTAVHNNPFSTDLAWNLERVRLIIPQWQREIGGVGRRVHISQAVRHNLSLKPQIILRMDIVISYIKLNYTNRRWGILAKSRIRRTHPQSQTFPSLTM